MLYSKFQTWTVPILLAKADKLDVVYYNPFALLIGYYHVAGR